MPKYKVLYTDTCFPDTSIESAELAAIDAELILAPATDEDSLIAAGKDCDGVIFDFAPMTDRVLSNLPKCKVASRVGIGLNNIDIPAASRNGIMVANVPDYCFEEVANHAVALYLACNRRLTQYDHRIKDQGNWDVTGVGPIYRMTGQNFCLYGLGNIARRVVKRVKPYGFHVYAYDAYASDEVFQQMGVTRVNSVEELAELADAFSVHVPLTPETEGTIDRNIFRRMKKDAIFVNIARGPIVKEEDLIAALNEGMIMAAGLDVVSVEPLPADSPLLKMDNVLITPHAAFYTLEAEDELRKRSTEEVIYALTEGKPHVFVNQPDFAV